MTAKQITGDLFIVLAVVFTVYLSLVMVQRIHAVVLKDIYIEVFYYELAVCAVFLLFALDFRFGILTAGHHKAVKTVGWLLRVVVIGMVAVLLFFFGRITAGSFIRTDASGQNALVLGLALENGHPAEDLRFRLDTAGAYSAAYPEAMLVLTGGNPDETGRTEAAVMRDLLLNRGVAKDRLLLEDQASDTKENFRNAARMMDPQEPTVLITSNYHMDRAVQTAKGAGFSHILRLPAPSSFRYYGANVMWEVMMEINELTLKR